MLDEMIKFQKSFQERIYPDFDPETMSYKQKVELTKNYALCLHEEVAEVTAATKYKTYHKYDKEYTDESVKLEIIDCLKFIINLGVLWGMDASEFKKYFDEKSQENLRRLL